MANWDKIQSKGKVNDRRGKGAGLNGVSISGIILLMGVTYLMGGNPLNVLTQVDINQIQTTTSEDTSEFDGLDEYELFASTIVGSNNDYWREEFSKSGSQYVEPTLVLFRGQTQSACGGAHSAIGPHYCPADQTIYLDETFFDEMVKRLGASGGDVAEAYVIAHEVGHHVQNLQDTISQRSNEDSIKTELQADCFAGLWANSIKDQNVFLPNEIKEAMDAAAAVGDDRIQEKMEGSINPESWTHGSSKERVSSFMKGYETGNFATCSK